jgi:hypothetical protein
MWKLVQWSESWQESRNFPSRGFWMASRLALLPVQWVPGNRHLVHEIRCFNLVPRSKMCGTSVTVITHRGEAVIVVAVCWYCVCIEVLRLHTEHIWPSQVSCYLMLGLKEASLYMSYGTWMYIQVMQLQSVELCLKIAWSRCSRVHAAVHHLRKSDLSPCELSSTHLHCSVCFHAVWLKIVKLEHRELCTCSCFEVVWGMWTLPWRAQFRGGQE